MPPRYVSEEEIVRRGKKTIVANRAQQRAFARVRDLHREDYDRIFAEEKDKAERELGLK